MTNSGLIALEDGRVFHGIAVGATGYAVGELVFNTATTGYQEIISDPSYAKQIVTFTHPHIGNVGVNDDDIESVRPWVSGIVVRDLSPVYSNYRATGGLAQWLMTHNIIAVSEIDTRALTHILRDQGSMKACIVSDPNLSPQVAIEHANRFAGLEHCDLTREVTCKTSYVVPAQGDVRDTKTVVIIDYGVKRHIIELLRQLAITCVVMPATSNVDAIMAKAPDAVLLSNGPGDPQACTSAIETIKQLIERDIPLFGICLGHQLLALACGAQTRKMKFGHHASNHPVKDLDSGLVAITSQNHGFTVCDAALPDCLTVTHRSLFDGTVQGIRHNTRPIMGFQGHPEASPGPHDLHPILQQFVTTFCGVN